MLESRGKNVVLVLPDPRHGGPRVAVRIAGGLFADADLSLWMMDASCLPLPILCSFNYSQRVRESSFTSVIRWGELPVFGGLQPAPQ